MTRDLSRRKLLRSAAALAVAPPLLSVLSCDEGTDAVKFSGATMGTTWRVIVADPPHDLRRQALASEIRGILARVDKRMSTWRGNSEVTLYNSRPHGTATPISSETAAVIAGSLRISRLSSGAFDPTIGPAVRLWGFGPEGSTAELPSQGAVDDALARTGAHYVNLSPGLPVLSKGRTGLEIDLSGIAKGFSVDLISRRLSARGLRNHLIEVGGELRASGVNPEGAPWRIGVEKPMLGSPSVQRVIAMREGAVATSGDYRNFFTQEGALYSHVIDPRTGRPVTHALTSVTVVAASCMEADALSTAMMVMGPDAGHAFARGLRISAIFMVKDGRSIREVATPEFAKYNLA
jgi:thiamine biosynthesis lipoprotein